MFYLAAAHLSTHAANLAAWVTIAFILLCLFWGLLKLLKIV